MDFLNREAHRPLGEAAREPVGGVARRAALHALRAVVSYVLVDRDGAEGHDDYDDIEEACRHAAHTGCAVVRKDDLDRELVWTPDGSRVWPIR